MPILPNNPLSSTQPLPPPPKPKPVEPEPPAVRRAPAASPTGRLAPDGVSVAGARGSSRLGLGETRPATGQLSPEAAAKQEEAALKQDLEKLQGQAKGLDKPEALHALAQKAYDLAARAENAGSPSAQHAAAFAARLDKADQAVAKLAGIRQSLDTPGVERTAAIADALANPGTFKAALKDLVPLKDSPLLAHQQAHVEAITDKATAEALGKQLATGADLSLYPAGFAENLGKLRDVKDPALRKGLDQVGQRLLDGDQMAKDYVGPPEYRPTSPLSAEAIKAQPALGKLIAPLADSKDAAVRQQVKGVAENLTQASLEDAVAKGGQGGLADAFKKPFDDLGAKTGLAKEMQAALPAQAEAVAKSHLEMGVSLDDMKGNAALAQLVGTLQTSKDPALKEQLGKAVDGWLQGSLRAGLEANAKDGHPDTAAADTMKAFVDDAKALAENTGLGELIQSRLPEAQKQVALSIAKDDDLKLDAFKNNPAYAQVLSTLNADPATKGLADEKVKRLTEESVDRNLDGKEGEDGVKDAMDGVKKDLTVLGQAGLGPNVQAKAEEAIKNKNDQISDTIDKGKSLWDRFTGAIEGVLGDIGDFVGDVVKGVGDIAGDVAGTVAGGVVDAFGGNGDAVKNAVNNGIDDFSAGVGDSLDSTISSAAHAVLHPLDTAKALTTMALHPVETAKAIWNEASKSGIMHALGYGLTTIATSIYGGQLAGNALGKLNQGATALAGSSLSAVSKLGTAAQWTVGKLQALRNLPSTLSTRAGELGTAITGAIGGNFAHVTDATGTAASLTNRADQVLNTIGALPGAIRHAPQAIQTGVNYMRTHTPGQIWNQVKAGAGAEARVAKAEAGAVLRGGKRIFDGDMRPSERALLAGATTRLERWKALGKIELGRVQTVAGLYNRSKLSKVVNAGSDTFTIVANPGVFLGRTIQSLLERGGAGQIAHLAQTAGRAVNGGLQTAAYRSYVDREQAAHDRKMEQITKPSRFKPQ